MKSLFSTAHVSQWWSVEWGIITPSSNTSLLPLHRHCFLITHCIVFSCNSVILHPPFLYQIIKKNMCRWRQFLNFIPYDLQRWLFHIQQVYPVEKQGELLEAWIKSTEIEQESQMASVSFYLALKWSFGLLLSLKYNQAIATWHKLREWSGSWLIYLENHQLSISIHALMTQTKSNFKQMQTQPLSGPISEKNTLSIPSGSLCRSYEAYMLLLI